MRTILLLLGMTLGIGSRAWASTHDTRAPSATPARPTQSSVGPVRSPSRPPTHTPLLTAQVAWATRYLTDGFKIGGDHPVWHLSALATTPIQGLSFGLWSAIQADRTQRVWDEIDLLAAYQHTFFSKSASALEWSLVGDYFVYPNAEGPWIPKGNKLQTSLALPQLLPLLGGQLIPSIQSSYWLYWDQGQRSKFLGGAHYQAGLQYDHSLPRLFRAIRQQYVGLGGTVNYHDGAFGVSPGLSHTTAHFGTSVHTAGWIVSAMVQRQWSYQPTVNPDDDLWTSFSLRRTF